jgi:hypothetical protein
MKNDESKNNPVNPYKIYQERYLSMPTNERLDEAAYQTGESLLALCHDPDTNVIRRVLENHTSGLAHARLIAEVHNTSSGLGFICRNPQLIKDHVVQQKLLKNAVLTDSQLRGVLNSKTLKQAWNIAKSTECAQNNKNRARMVVKEKFRRASQEERAAFIYDTEGRVLMLIHDIPFGEKAISILCKKTYNSVLLIQNLAKCSKTPARLLLRLEKQSIVRHNQGIKQLIKRHANYPKSFSRNKK